MKKSKSKTKMHKTHARNNDVQTLTIRIDLERQDKADLDYLCHSLGINIQIAVRIFLAQMLQVGGLPFDVRLPEFNEETIAAMQEAKDIMSGKIQAKRYDSVEEMFADDDDIAASEENTNSENAKTSTEDTTSEENTASNNTDSEKQSIEESAMPSAMRVPKKKVVLGVARGKYNIPADIDGCNYEIAAMFGAKSKDNDATSENTTSENTTDIAACEQSISSGYTRGRFDDLILSDLIKEGYESEALLAEFRIRRENRKLKATVHRAIRVTNNSFQELGIDATLEDALGERYAVSDESNDKNEVNSGKDSSDLECDRTPSGEFDDLILADLIKEGYEGEALLAEFRIRRAEIRPAVEKLLQQADDAAKGIGEYSTLEEVFGKR